MNGKEIYKFAVTTVTEDTAVALSDAGIGPDDVDFYLLHQANGRIIDAARCRLGQPESKFPICLDNTGNTSSASIPILMDRLNKDHRLKKGDILLLSAFGGGLTSGTCIMKWEK
jgi:3-oxoacyl-[acyl-carrier-protein] synthase-3